MGVWDRIKRTFRPADVVVTPEPPPVAPPPPVPAPPPRPMRTYNPPLMRSPGLRAGPPPTARPVERNLELEAVIAADPDAVEPYLVYADWLQARGDPRGELIVVHHA